MQQPERIDQLLHAVPVEFGGKIITPVARVEGWWLGGSSRAGAWVRLSPVAVTVRQDEQRYEVPISDPEQSVIRTFVLIGGAVAVVALLVMLLTTYWSRRR